MLLHKKQSIGLDIADRSIAVVALAQTNDGCEIINRGYLALPSGIVERGRIKDAKKLAAALHEVFTQASLDPLAAQIEVVFGLPESQIYFHLFNLPLHQAEERERLAQKAALMSIPLPADDLLYSYAVLSEEAEKVNILLIAASRTIVSAWQSFFESVGLNVAKEFDVEPLAIRRGLFLESLSAPVCVVDIGAVTSGINIFDDKGLRYTYSVLIAGDTLTHEIAKISKMSWEEAENLKIRVGLTKDGDNILAALVKILEPLSNEIKTALSYYKQNFGQPAAEVVFVGGTSRLKGLVDYFTANLDLPVRLGDPAVKVARRKKSSSPTTKRGSKIETNERDNDFYYLEAIGLARRAFSGWWKNIDPSLNLAEVHEVTSSKNVLAKIERTIEKEEAIIKNAAKRVWSHRVWLAGLAIVCLITAGLIGYWYLFYESTNQFKSADKPLAADNRAVSSLVFPEGPLENLDSNFGTDTDSGEEPSPSVGSESENQESLDTTGPEQPPGAVISPESEKVLILDTPTGWLNVRSGPGKNYPIITKVYPGKSYPLLQEEEKWYKIQLDSGGVDNTQPVNNKDEGWVASQYATKE